MKQNFNTRIKKGLFPEMPQSFADGLQRAAAACGSQNTRTESTPETGSEPKKRRFPVGKVLAGATAAVLVAACVVIAVFVPGIARNSHGATEPVVDPLLGKWTVTEIRIDGSSIDPKSFGDVQITLEFSEDGNATLSGVAPQGDIRGDIQERGQYTVTGNTVILTDEGGDTLELSYDPAADTLYMEHTYSGEYDLTLGLIFSRTPEPKTPLPEDMLEGLWCALPVDPDQVLLLEIRFYTDAATSERKAEIIKDGISCDGYSYTVEKWEQSQKNTGNLWYRFTFIDGDEELTIDLCVDTDGKEPIYMDWNVDKSDGGTYLKCPVIEANELPMQYTEYYGAGEGFVGYLAAVDLNGDGNPVRVKVASDDPNWFIEKGEEPELTVQIGRGEWTANEVLVWDSVIFADLDPNDGHGNVLLSVKRADETIFTYELHSEGDTVVCGHVGEGYSNTYAMSTNIDLYEKTSLGAWSHTVGVDYEQRITIRADGTATLKQTAGALGTFEVQLTYTETDGELQFFSAYTGRNDSFTAVYDAERDVLAVTRNGETAEYERRIPDLANSFWTLIEMTWDDGKHTSAEEAGVESTLTFQDGTMTELRTVNANGLTSRTEYRYLTEADSILLRVNGMDVNDPEITYDPETDTLRLFTSDDGRTCVYIRTPDAVIPAGERKEITELRKQYPEYFDLDTSKGLKVYVWQMAENDFSCAMISGTDERSELEIGIQCKGTTIEQMRLIYSTYDAVKNDIDVEVVPFHNPISSYWYEIDKDYTDHVTWLTIGVSDAWIDDAEIYDVDGDGQLETCSLNQGPTSGLFTVVFTAYRNGTLAYRNTFDMDYGELTFNRSDKGLMIQHVIPWNDGAQIHTEYRISIENGMIVLTDEIRGGTVDYWGLDDPQWNMRTPTATAEKQFGGAWYCYDKGLASDPGYDELLLIEFDPDGRHVSFTEDRKHYEGYTWQTDADDPNVLILTNETTGDVRRATLETDAKLRFETDLNARGERSEWTYYSLPDISAEDLPFGEPANLWQSFISTAVSGTDPAWCNGPLGMFDLDGDGKLELIRLTWKETDRKMTVEAFTNHNRAAYTGYIAPGAFGTNEGELYYTVENVTDPLNLILIDLDPSDGHVNLLVSADTENGGYIYELHVENGALVCGHVIEGYCFLADSSEQELMLGMPTDLFGAKFGYREVRGEALEPVDDRLFADLVSEKIAFVSREKNIEDGTLLHLVRALPCEIDGVSGTLEPNVYIYLREWNESLTEIVFMTEDGRWITVHPDAGLFLDGVSLYDCFDNTPER